MEMLKGLRVSDLLLLDAEEAKDLWVADMDPFLLRRLGRLAAARADEVSSLLARIRILHTLADTLEEYENQDLREASQ